jgi:predicted nucleotidyltransferase
MKTLSSVLISLEKSPDVDAVFLTGSRGRGEHTQASDIDLVIILADNAPRPSATYEIIDEQFADIFFFTKSELQELSVKKEVRANALSEGILLGWIEMADIIFDRSGVVHALKERAPHITQVMSTDEQQAALQKLSYNYIQNSRYFDSGRSLYHEALLIRLGYSSIECITTLLTLRSIPWRGEKNAVTYLKQHAPEFYEHFRIYGSSPTLKDKMAAYTDMVHYIANEHPLYTYTSPVSTNPDQTICSDRAALLWQKISSGSDT